MKRFLFLLLFFSGCSNNPTRPRPDSEVQIEDIAPASVDSLFRGVRLDSLPYTLGAPWRYAAFRAEFTDGTSLVFLPMDEDDEHRYLVRISENGQDGSVLAIGFTEPTWFSAVLAETLDTYDGWTFLYDLSEGLRRISVLTESGVILELSTDYPYKTRPPDLLADSDRFSCCVRAMLKPPDIPSRIHLRPDDTAVRTRLAKHVRLLFQCSSTSPALPKSEGFL